MVATGCVIKPRPDGRRHLRTWTSGRTLVEALRYWLRYSISAQHRDLQPLGCYRNHHAPHFLPHSGKSASPTSANQGSCLLPPRGVCNTTSCVPASVLLTLITSLDSANLQIQRQSLLLRTRGSDDRREKRGPNLQATD